MSQGQAPRDSPRMDEDQLGWDGSREERTSSSKKIVFGLEFCIRKLF